MYVYCIFYNILYYTIYQVGIIFKSNIKNKPRRTTTHPKHVLRLKHLDIGLNATASFEFTQATSLQLMLITLLHIQFFCFERLDKSIVYEKLWISFSI